MRTSIVIILWFVAVTTIAIVFASCGTSKSGCDAYGQVNTEERI